MNTNIYLNPIGTSPIAFPKIVYGISIANILIEIEDAYTAFDAWLCIIGFLIVAFYVI